MLVAVELPLQGIIAIATLFVGGGGALWVFQVRYLNKKIVAESVKTTAEASKVDKESVKLAAETAVILSTQVQKGYDDLLKSMSDRMINIETERAQCKIELNLVQTENAANKQRIYNLDAKVVDVEVKLGISNVLVGELRNRLEEMDATYFHDPPKPTKNTVSAVKTAAGIRKRAPK